MWRSAVIAAVSAVAYRRLAHWLDVPAPENPPGWRARDLEQLHEDWESERQGLLEDRGRHEEEWIDLESRTRASWLTSASGKPTVTTGTLSSWPGWGKSSASWSGTREHVHEHPGSCGETRRASRDITRWLRENAPAPATMAGSITVSAGSRSPDGDST